jgi:DNA-binding transcriptional ArsR family regulator
LSALGLPAELPRIWSDALAQLGVLGERRGPVIDTAAGVVSAGSETSTAYGRSMETPGLADVAAVLADPSRSTMCLALLDGRAWTVGELARAGRLAPSTATEHVNRLRTAAFVQTLRQGRHTYVRISDPRVAELVERIAEHSRPPAQRGLRATLRAERLSHARTCYDHLAGRLGVRLRDGMIAARLLDTSGGLALTAAGRSVFAALEVTLPAATGRAFLRDCLDWTERREHLAGGAAAALLNRCLSAGWLKRFPDRAIRVLPAAREPFGELGVQVQDFTDQRERKHHSSAGVR